LAWTIHPTARVRADRRGTFRLERPWEVSTHAAPGPERHPSHRARRIAARELGRVGEPRLGAPTRAHPPAEAAADRPAPVRIPGAAVAAGARERRHERR